MTTNHPEKSELRVSVGRRAHKFLTHHFSKLRGIGGGAVLGLWLFGGFFLLMGGQGFIRFIGLVLLVLFVATYLFLAYFYPDDAA
jgi:hypothetical protein